MVAWKRKTRKKRQESVEWRYMKVKGLRLADVKMQQDGNITSKRAKPWSLPGIGPKSLEKGKTDDMICINFLWHTFIDILYLCKFSCPSESSSSTLFAYSWKKLSLKEKQPKADLDEFTVLNASCQMKADFNAKILKFISPWFINARLITHVTRWLNSQVPAYWAYSQQFQLFGRQTFTQSEESCQLSAIPSENYKVYSQQPELPEHC